jgi:hypothetical protein
MTIRRTFPNSSNSPCDQCGQPAAWRTRAISTCCVLGVALCNSCERKSRHMHWWRRNDNLWAELAGDVGWLAGKITSGLGKLRPNRHRLEPKIGWPGNITGKNTPP